LSEVLEGTSTSTDAFDIKAAEDFAGLEEGEIFGFGRRSQDPITTPEGVRVNRIGEELQRKAGASAFFRGEGVGEPGVDVGPRPVRGPGTPERIKDVTDTAEIARALDVDEATVQQFESAFGLRREIDTDDEELFATTRQNLGQIAAAERAEADIGGLLTQTRRSEVDGESDADTSEIGSQDVNVEVERRDTSPTPDSNIDESEVVSAPPQQFESSASRPTSVDDTSPTAFDPAESAQTFGSESPQPDSSDSQRVGSPQPADSPVTESPFGEDPSPVGSPPPESPPTDSPIGDPSPPPASPPDDSPVPDQSFPPESPPVDSPIGDSSPPPESPPGDSPSPTPTTPPEAPPSSPPEFEGFDDDGEEDEPLEDLVSFSGVRDVEVRFEQTSAEEIFREVPEVDDA